MAVEVNGRPLSEDVLRGWEWQRLLEARERLETPYGLLFSPGKAILVKPDGETLTFEGQMVLDTYGLHQVPRYFPGAAVETALYTWLVDLTMGIDRPSPSGFPQLKGDEVRRAA